MRGEDAGLDELFRQYRASCPEIEPDANFMPNLWRKIDARRGFWPVFEHLARTGMAAAALLCLLLLALNFVSTSHRSVVQSYTDALMADHSAERTYYTEAILNTPSPEEAPVNIQH